MNYEPEWGQRLAAWASNAQNIEQLRESCPFHMATHGVMGGVFGGFLGMFLASMSAGGTTPEARLLSPTTLTPEISALPIKTQVRLALSDLAKRSWSSARNFGKIAAIYSGSECVIEGVSASRGGGYCSDTSV